MLAKLETRHFCLKEEKINKESFFLILLKMPKVLPSSLSSKYSMSLLQSGSQLLSQTCLLMHILKGVLYCSIEMVANSFAQRVGLAPQEP